MAQVYHHTTLTCSSCAGPVLANDRKCRLCGADPFLPRVDPAGWYVNPGDTFPLHLVGATPTAAAHIREILTRWDCEGFDANVAKLAPIFAAGAIACREVDDFVAAARAELLPVVEAKCARSRAYAKASAEEREDIRDNVWSDAIGGLDAQPCVDFDDLVVGPAEEPWRSQMVAGLFFHTWFSSHTTSAQLAEFRSIPEVCAVKVLAVRDDRTCRCCKRLTRRRYKLTEAPRLPAHLGCRCIYDPRFTWER